MSFVMRRKSRACCPEIEHLTSGSSGRLPVQRIAQIPTLTSWSFLRQVHRFLIKYISTVSSLNFWAATLTSLPKEA